jgi:hypothetical protein
MTEKKLSIEATCPECRGPLSEVQIESESPAYCCLVGHRYSAMSLLEAHSETQEKALWAAVVALEESGVIVQRVAGEFPPEVGERLRSQATRKQEQALEIRKVLEKLETFLTS